MSRETLLLIISILIVIGVGIYAPMAQGEPAKLVLVLPFVAVLLLFILLLYLVGHAERRLAQLIDLRLPPVEHLQDRQGVESQLVGLAETAEAYIVATGGRSRSKTYLDAITRKVKSGRTDYWRILWRDTITHETCQHLTDVLGLPGVAISLVDDRSFGHMLVTDSCYLIALPVPGRGELLGLKVPNPSSAQRVFQYLMRVNQLGALLSQPADIQALCEECQRRSS